MAVKASASLVWLSCWVTTTTFWWGAPVVQAKHVDKTKADFEVVGMEKIEPSFKSFDGEMYAGTLPIAHPSNMKEDDGEYMFWLFEPTTSTADDSLIIWFNGGPGCTSFSAGLFFEMGPITIPLRPAGYLPGSEEYRAPLGPNPYGWTKAGNVMYVEQPVNVGYSVGSKDPQNETDIGRALDGFLQHFVHVFEDYRDKRIFLVGESYAGMYVPSMAYFIHQRNKHGRPDDEYDINLGGIGLGNGWVDPIIQGGTVIDWAWWHGMIDSVTRDDLYREWNHCIQKGPNEQAPFHPYTVPDECGMMGVVAQAAGAGLLPHGWAPNVYDASTWDPYDLINRDDSTIPIFFNNPDVQKALNVPDSFTGPWMGCIPGAGRRLTEKSVQEEMSRMVRRRSLHLLDQDRPESMHKYMVNLLDDAKINVLVYNGDRDITCNSVGTEIFLDSLSNWSGADGWKDPTIYQRGLWLPDQEDEQQAIAGYAKEHQNLQFVIVVNSGHLVPYNRPVAALDLITRLLTSESYVDKKIDPIEVDVTLPALDENDSEPFQHGHKHRWKDILITTLIAFAAGWFVSRYSHSKKSGGYESVPSASG